MSFFGLHLFYIIYKTVIIDILQILPCGPCYVVRYRFNLLLNPAYDWRNFSSEQYNTVKPEEFEVHGYRPWKRDYKQ